MTIQNYLIIENNVVTNTVVWDGNTGTWQPPTDCIYLIQATTPALIWKFNSVEYVLEQEIGVGSVGFTWDGSVLTTNEPQPQLPIASLDQPVSNGTITI